MMEEDVHRSQIPAQVEGQIDRNVKLSMVAHAFQSTFQKNNRGLSELIATLLFPTCLGGGSNLTVYTNRDDVVSFVITANQGEIA